MSGGRGSGVKKISISTGKFPKSFTFFRQFYKRISSLVGKFPKILIFSGNKKLIFQAKKVHLQLPLGKLFYFSSKVTTFEHTSPYMIRYNNILRPVHDSNDPPATLPATPRPKSGGRDPQPPGFTPPGSNGEEAFELPRGGLRRMKMPQEKNGENTDLKCDLVLCRNKDYEKGGHHKIGSL